VNGWRLRVAGATLAEDSAGEPYIMPLERTRGTWVPALLCSLLGLPAASWADRLPDIEESTVQEDTASTGTHIPETVARTWGINPKKRYEQLSPDELSGLRRNENLTEGDEPAYPKNGLEEIIREMATIQKFTRVKGHLFATVRVDAHGDAQSVQFFKTPSRDLDQVFAFPLLKAKYKPAICHGSPCVKDFPVLINFAPESTDPRHEHALALLARANRFMTANDVPHEIDDLTEAIRLDPTFVVPWVHRGFALIRMKQFDQAIADFDKAISILPSYGDAYRGRGSVYFRKNDYERAIRDLSDAIELRPTADEYSLRASAYERAGQYERAMADYDESIRRYPKDDRAFNSRCWARAKANVQLDSALEDCNEALRLNPNYRAALDSRGYVYLRMTRYEDAVRDFSLCIDSDPGAYSSLYGRALAKRALGDLDGSESDLQAARKINPSMEAEFTGFEIAH